MSRPAQNEGIGFQNGHRFSMTIRVHVSLESRQATELDVGVTDGETRRERSSVPAAAAAGTCMYELEDCFHYVII